MVKGPNRIWSIDGHDKLSAYGFQIYGIIDAYSRKILGVFVGLSNRTQIAVLKYYINTIENYGVPKAVRADKGAETLLAAAAQFAFRRAQKPSIVLEKVWAYGTSTKNQRIERWWRTLVDGQTDQWIAYFDELKANGLFDSSKFDIIALQYLYMDTLRQHIASFVHMYNTHAIRKQVSREFYLPSGKPNFLYNYPSDGVRNYSAPPDQSLLLLIQDQLSWFDETAYLAPTTRVLCDNIISQSNITYDLTKILPGTEQPHTQAYNVLRKGLYQWEMVEKRGIVEQLQPPIGSLSTIEAMVQKFQSEETSSRRDSTTLLGEIELNSEDEDEAEDEAQIDAAGDVEFGDDGIYFEP
jgi:transposase InsO family protein